jgi:hypothetical protein
MRSSTTSATAIRLCGLVALALAALAVALAAPARSHAEGKPTTEAPPAVSTGGVSHVTSTSATLRGSVNPHGLATTYYFKYGPTEAYGSQTTPASLPAGKSESVKVGQAVTGLRAGYHYRLVASNAKGPGEGKDRTYTAKAKHKKQGSAFKLAKSFQPTLVGGSFVLSGSLSGANNGDRAIALQATPYPYRTPFVDVGAPIQTSASGAFSFRVAKLSRSTKFRVATVGAPLLTSATVAEPVQVRVILKVRTSKHAKGLVRLYGTVSPAEVGAHVFFQLESTPKAKARPIKAIKPEKPGKSEKEEEKAERPKFSTKFKAVVKRGTRSLSRFSAVVKVQTSGHYRAFVALAPGPLASGTSETVMLHAAPAAKKKHKNSGG